MKISIIIYLVIIGVISAIETIEASKNSIRYVTPKKGIDYKIRTVTPNPKIRYVRSITTNDELYSTDQIISQRLSERSIDFNDDLVEHEIERRSPERVVINYKPPRKNGPRYARSV